MFEKYFFLGKSIHRKMATPNAPPDDVKLYPKLDPVASSDDVRLYPQLETGLSFRLSEITNIRNTLQDEAAKRVRLRQKYKTAYVISHALNTGVCVVASVTTAGAVGTLAAGVGAIAALPLGIISLAAGAVGLVGSATQKILLKKLEKHNRILALSEAKLCTIDRLVSKALKDSFVSDLEFDAIQEEMADYRAKRREIQIKIRASTNTDLEKFKKDMIERGRKKGLQEAKRALNEKS